MIHCSGTFVNNDTSRGKQATNVMIDESCVVFLYFIILYLSVGWPRAVMTLRASKHIQRFYVYSDPTVLAS